MNLSNDGSGIDLSDLLKYFRVLSDPEFKPELLDAEVSVGPVGGGMFGMAVGVPYENEDDPKPGGIHLTEIMRSR